MSSSSPMLRSAAAILTCCTMSFGLPSQMGYQQDPKALGRDAARVHEWIGDVGFAVLGGGGSSLHKVFGEKGLVVAMRDPECPLSKKYSPRLKTLAAEAERMGFGFLFVGMDTAEAARKDREHYGLAGNYAVDPEGEIARELEATTSTEVFVIDGGHTLVYRGMIDDQYGLGFSKVAAERHFLVEALEAVADGRYPISAATQAQGCLLEIEAGPRLAKPVTYHNRISRIVQDRCQPCHRPGEAGPFALMNFKQVKKRRTMLAWALEEQVMPPWFATEESGPWANNKSLTERELEDFLGWIENGAPEGSPSKAPLEPEWVDGWTIGEPDLVVTFPDAFQVPAEGVVDYQYFYAQTNLTEGKWIKAVELRSSGKEVVHHALVFVEAPQKGEKGRRRRSTGFNTGGETFFASAVPGQSGLTFPAGTGKYLPAGAWIKFQMHYTANGTATTDQTSLGLVFSDEPLVEIQTTSAINDSFTIPARASGYKVSAEYRFPVAATLLGLFPHTHVRGNAFECELVYPDGQIRPLLELPFYDFNWQLNYRLAEPFQVPAGTRLRATAWYDNSEDNPANPNPNVNVRFGEQTWEEMMIAYVNWIPSAAQVIEASSKSPGK